MRKIVSIVLPVYNGEKYLRESIESVLQQSYQNIELIIVNDCSTDSTEEIILHYKELDSRIVYIKNEKNSKLPQSLNNGFAVAKGEYFSWTSDDNIFHKNAIEKMVDGLETNTGIGLVYCDYNLIDENGNLLKMNFVGEKDQLLFENIIGACFLYRREVAISVGNYNPKFFLVEDYDYWLRINMYHAIMPIHECLYDYRIHNSSLRETRRSEIYTALGVLFWDYLPKYEALPIPDDKLFKYFNFILSFIPNRKDRIKKRFDFSLRHRRYIATILKRIFSRRDS